jgi:uncharacterized protein
VRHSDVPRRLNGSHPPVFVDASAWLASINERDQHYEVASTLLSQLIDDHAKLVTTNWTAFEALSMLKSRLGPHAARRLWMVLQIPHTVDLIRIDPTIEARALELFFAYGDKTWGVVDCASMIVMEEIGCQRAIAFDHHFVEASRQRGFQLLP